MVYCLFLFADSTLKRHVIDYYTYTPIKYVHFLFNDRFSVSLKAKNVSASSSETVHLF